MSGGAVGARRTSFTQWGTEAARERLGYHVMVLPGCATLRPLAGLQRQQSGGKGLSVILEPQGLTEGR